MAKGEKVKRARRGGEAFYGDTGAGPAREDIEKQESSGAGHPGNNVDISQRYAQSEAEGENDWCYQTAKAIVRNWARDNPYQRWVKDPEQRQERVEQMAEQLRESFDKDGHLGISPAQSQKPPKEAEEQQDDHEFMNNPEKWNEIRKKEKNIKHGN